MTKNVFNLWERGANDPFSQLFASAPIMMQTIDRDGVITDVSQFLLQCLGYSQSEIVGKNAFDFLAPDSAENARNVIWPRLEREGRLHNVELDYLRADGGQLPVLLSASHQRDGDQHIQRTLVILFDNSEAKRTLALLSQSQRMETVGRLVGGVAHDFNNLLTVIQGNLEFLQDDMDSPSREAYLHDAFGAARRGAALTQQLLAFGRRASLSPKKSDLNSLTRNFDSMLRRLMPEGIEFEINTQGGVWTTRVDPTRLETALLNIVNNARDAMPSGGKITIETANVNLTKNYADTHDQDLTPGPYVMVAVSDTGSGMTSDVVSQVFEPFFTTKPVHQGAGLGMSMVYGFVKQSNGSVRVQSEPGFGTTVRLYFPGIDAKQGDGMTLDGDTQETVDNSPLAEVLVVEDEDAVRRILVAQLKAKGLRVQAAPSGDIAMAMLSGGYIPRVLVTDVLMPGQIQGPDLASQARELIPDLKVVFITGYPDKANLDRAKARQGETLLAKPVSGAVLSRTVLDQIADQ